MAHFPSATETAESTDRDAQYREVGEMYRCRAEFEAEGRLFIEAAGITRFHLEPLFPEGHVLHHAPDRLLTFTSDKDLGQLIRIAAKIVDNHVLAETLMPLDKYTPDRSSLRVFLAHGPTVEEYFGRCQDWQRSGMYLSHGPTVEEYFGPLCEVAVC